MTGAVDGTVGPGLEARADREGAGHCPAEGVEAATGRIRAHGGPGRVRAGLAPPPVSAVLLLRLFLPQFFLLQLFLLQLFLQVLFGLALDSGRDAVLFVLR